MPAGLSFTSSSSCAFAITACQKQCVLIAQSAEQHHDELTHADTGGAMGKDGKESIHALKYNAVSK